MWGNELLSFGRLLSDAARRRNWLVLDEVGRVNALEAMGARLIECGVAGIADWNQGRGVDPTERGHRFIMIARNQR